MRHFGARAGVAVVVALVAATAALGAPVEAQAHHHRHHHHHHTSGGGTPVAPPASLCAATPQTVTLTLFGDGSTSVSCHGLGPLEAVTVDSLLLRGNCAAVTFNGATPPIGLTSDAGGNLSFSIAGFNCLAGAYTVQLVGSITTTEFPVSMTF